MVDLIYIEEEVAEHPRTHAIRARFPKATTVSIERYGEVFNRAGQNFRLQKQRPSLILARKHGQRVLPTPEGYGIGGQRNFYFSHMLNCPYDCRYCFLQGMFRSAAYVVFVDYEDVFEAVAATVRESESEDSWFFSGYDCDSLAFEGVTGFVDAALPVFAAQERAWLELRTKSVRIEPLRRHEPFERCVVAFSLTPEATSRALEQGVPSVERRLRALVEVAERGWPIGLRFDPLIYVEGFESHYRGLFDAVFEQLDPAAVHSVSLGPFRLPTGFFRKIEKLHPDAPLFAGPFEDRGGMTSYHRQLEADLVGFVTQELARRVPEDRFFPCPLPDGEVAA